jgi:hypothetical protein
VAALVLLTVPVFLDMSAQALHDTLQCFLLIVTFGAVLRRADVPHALLGAAIAGLAFGTKYAALFLLPFCVMPQALIIFASAERGRAEIASILKLIVVATAIFVTMFAATNPYALGNLDFYRTIVVQADWMSIGHGKVEPKNPLYWLPVLDGQLGLIGVSLLFSGTLLTAAQTLREWRERGWRECALNASWRNRLTLLFYVVLTVTYLLVAVRLRLPRYTLHILPFWIVVSLWGFWNLYSRLHWTRLQSPQLLLTKITAIVLILLCIVQAEHSVGKMAAATMRPLSPMIEAGEFLLENCPRDTRILADRYSYIPPKFAHTRLVWGVDEQEFRAFAPQLVVLNKSMSGRWIWKAPGTKFKEGRFTIDLAYGGKPAEVKAFWQSLAADEWISIYENPEVVILSKGSVDSDLGPC